MSDHFKRRPLSSEREDPPKSSETITTTPPSSSSPTPTDVLFKTRHHIFSPTSTYQKSQSSPELNLYQAPSLTKPNTSSVPFKTFSNSSSPRKIINRKMNNGGRHMTDSPRHTVKNNLDVSSAIAVRPGAPKTAGNFEKLRTDSKILYPSPINPELSGFFLSRF